MKPKRHVFCQGLRLRCPICFSQNRIGNPTSGGFSSYGKRGFALRRFLGVTGRKFTILNLLAV